MSRKSFTSENITRVRVGPGVYKLYAKNAKKPTYIGSSGNMQQRLKCQKRSHRFHSFKVHHTNTSKQARTKEEHMIKKNQPRRNRRLL
jgi:excinuclease UvrABC nuclease subunit